MNSIREALISYLKDQEAEKYLESCPYTKKSERDVDVKINLETFCSEHQIDFRSIDKDIFPDEINLSVNFEKACGVMLLTTIIKLGSDNTILYGGRHERLDKPNTVLLPADKYQLWAKEDEFIENDIKALLLLLIKDKRCVAPVFYYVDHVKIVNSFDKRCMIGAKMINGTPTLRTCSRSLAEAVTRIFDDLKVHVETERVLTNKANAKYWLDHAKAYIAEENKKKVEKKMKAEEETRARLAEDEKAES